MVTESNVPWTAPMEPEIKIKVNNIRVELGNIEDATAVSVSIFY